MNFAKFFARRKYVNYLEIMLKNPHITFLILTH